jgi:hypothetical protein
MCLFALSITTRKVDTEGSTSRARPSLIGSFPFWHGGEVKSYLRDFVFKFDQYNPKFFVNHSVPWAQLFGRYDATNLYGLTEDLLLTLPSRMMAAGINRHVMQITGSQSGDNDPSPLVTSTPITDADPKTPSLLSIVADIRNNIYELVVVRRYPVSIRTTTRYGSTRHVEPGLLRTCRQIRSESLRMYYERNRFDFVTVAGYLPLLTDVRSKVQMMRHIYVEISGFCSHHTYVWLDMSKGFKQIELRLVGLDGTNCGWMNTITASGLSHSSVARNT